LQRQVVVVQSISTAFLDTAVKKREQARQWLASDAAPWLGDLETLASK